MRSLQSALRLAAMLGLLLAIPGCPKDDDDAADDDSGDDDTADDDDDASDDDAGDDDSTGFCEQDGAALPDIFDPQLEGDCPFPGLADLVSAEAACATTLDSVVDFEITMAGNPYAFEPTQVCAISPLTVQDQAQTTSFGGFGLIFTVDDFSDFLVVALLDTAATPEDTWVSAADPLCPQGSAAQRGRLLTYARFGNACYIPGLTGEAAAWFDLYAAGTPAAGDYYVAEFCASLSEWDLDGPKAKITGDFQAQVGKDGVFTHTVELPDLCP